MSKRLKVIAVQCLALLILLQPAAAQDRDDAPIRLDALTDMLRTGKYEEEELVQMVTRRGVRDELTKFHENNIRLAMKGWGKKSDSLIKALRANFLGATVNEPLVLKTGTPARLEHLGFTATFVGRSGDDYVLEVTLPGSDKVVVITHADCEHTYTWGPPKFRRKFRLHIESATPKQVRAVLLRDVKPPVPAPPEIRNYGAPCAPVPMRLVTGNHTDAPNPLEPYYISEPVTVGVLRYHALSHPVRTPIPASAKDTDPITAIYYDDALEIATMLGTHLPTLHQLVNALNGKFMTLSSPAELVAEEGEDALTVVRQADSQNPSNNPLSSLVTTSKVPRGQMAKGLLRVIRLSKGQIIKVDPSDRNRPPNP